MAKHPGDSGNWNLDSAAPCKMTIRERVNTQLGVTSKAVIDAARKEDAFLASVMATKPDPKRFTDRRKPPGRDRLLP